MTPARLNELECPKCQHRTWILDSDYRGTDGVMMPYEQRHYECVHCRHEGAEWTLHQQAPATFLLQPHDLYPMSQVEFDYWAAILKTHFPDHPKLAGLGSTFVPRVLSEAEANRRQYEREHPVVEMTHQAGDRRVGPEFSHFRGWVDVMRPGDTVTLRRYDGRSLKVMFDGTTYRIRTHGEIGLGGVEARGVAQAVVFQAAERYMNGDLQGCAQQLRSR